MFCCLPGDFGDLGSLKVSFVFNVQLFDVNKKNEIRELASTS